MHVDEERARGDDPGTERNPAGVARTYRAPSPCDMDHRGGDGTGGKTGRSYGHDLRGDG